MLKSSIKFTVEKEQRDDWHRYAVIKGYRDVSHLATVAIVQYIARNPLTKKQAEIVSEQVSNSRTQETPEDRPEGLTQ